MKKLTAYKDLSLIVEKINKGIANRIKNFNDDKNESKTYNHGYQDAMEEITNFIRKNSI